MIIPLTCAFCGKQETVDFAGWYTLAPVSSMDGLPERVYVCCEAHGALWFARRLTEREAKT